VERGRVKEGRGEKKRCKGEERGIECSKEKARYVKGV
jgi:hypothetical protein